MSESLYAFRVIVKNKPHPTQSLTLRVFDMLASSAAEAEELARGPKDKHHIKVLPLDGQDLSQVQWDSMLARLVRRRQKRGISCGI